MLVKHLPTQIKTLAVTRQMEQNGEKDELMSLFEAFDWNKTSEGWNFWESMNCGIYTPFNEIYSTDYANEDWLIGDWDSDEVMLKQEYEAMAEDSMYINMAEYWDEEEDVEYFYSEHEEHVGSLNV
jgi:hypothetical protein